jgi:hypothetical protein
MKNRKRKKRKGKKKEGVGREEDPPLCEDEKVTSFLTTFIAVKNLLVRCADALSQRWCKMGHTKLKEAREEEEEEEQEEEEEETEQEEEEEESEEKRTTRQHQQ